MPLIAATGVRTLSPADPVPVGRRTIAQWDTDHPVRRGTGQHSQ
jgi:hypothetical protein